MFKLFDVHTHVQFDVFKADRDEVIKRSLDAGIGLVNVGTKKETSRFAVEIAEKYKEGVYATVGLHPIHTGESYEDFDESGDNSREENFDYDFYKNLARSGKVIAIGECGLDYFRLNEISKKIQEAAFIAQMGLAYELKKPLMIHCRKAYDDLIEILSSKSEILNNPPGVAHFFSGDRNHTRKLLDMGFYFSFGGVVTFSRDYDEMAKLIPIEKILLETDAPYVTPVPYRGKRNEPVYVEKVAKRVAELKGVTLEEVSRLTVENTKKLFSV